MNVPTKRIAVVQGATSPEIQRLLSALAADWGRTARIAGVIEDTDAREDAACDAGQLVSLTTGARFSIFQDQPRVPGVCNVDPAGPFSAGEAVSRDIDAGCDLVILSKFGKLEAEQKGGLLPAFITAAEAGVPILSSVSPKFEAIWAQFTEGEYERLPASSVAIEAWWHAVRAAEPTDS